MWSRSEIRDMLLLSCSSTTQASNQTATAVLWTFTTLSYPRSNSWRPLPILTVSIVGNVSSVGRYIDNCSHTTDRSCSASGFINTSFDFFNACDPRGFPSFSTVALVPTLQDGVTLPAVMADRDSVAAMLTWIDTLQFLKVSRYWWRVLWDGGLDTFYRQPVSCKNSGQYVSNWNTTVHGKAKGWYCVTFQRYLQRNFSERFAQQIVQVNFFVIIKVQFSTAAARITEWDIVGAFESIKRLQN